MTKIEETIDSEIFTAGAAEVDITPPLGTRIGVDLFTHYARVIHDHLYAKSLVLRKGDRTIAFVLVDVCIMPSDLMHAIKMSISQRTSIPYAQIVLSCTHTHGAADVAGLLGGAVDIAYRTKLPEWITVSVEDALERLQPAKICHGAVDVPDHVVCRRYRMKAGYQPFNPVTGGIDQVQMNPEGAIEMIDRPDGSVDSGLGFLAVKSGTDQWMAVLANYGLHYVGDWDVDTITADYYGAFARKIQEKLDAPSGFVGMMTHGTAGNVNIWDFLHPDRYPKEDHAKTAHIADELANKVVEALASARFNAEPALALVHDTLKLAIRKPPVDALNKATEQLKLHHFKGLRHDRHGLTMIYAREQLLLDEYPEMHTAAMQAIRIGDLTIGTLGGEIFAETGLWLKARQPKSCYFTICLANTYDGYVPPAHEHRKGGYETWRARSSFLEIHAEEKMKSTLLSLIESVHRLADQ